MRWRIEDGGSVFSLTFPAQRILASVDAEWPALRDADAEHFGWRWTSIGAKRWERFALLENGNVVALWATERPVVTLLDKVWYRLDYLEVHPGKRRQLLGGLALSLVAKRAAEVGAQGLVWGALPQSVPFWLASGAKVGQSPKGWQAPDGLIPCILEGEAFAELQGEADAIRSQEDEG